VAILASQGLHWSTREPAGVVVSHKKVIANCAQMMCDYFEDPAGVSVSSVSWLPFYHDMGLMQGVLMPMVNQDTAVLLCQFETEIRCSRNRSTMFGQQLHPVGPAVSKSPCAFPRHCSCSLAKALNDFRQDTLRLRVHTLVVVDVAAMVGTRDLRELLAATTAAGVKTCWSATPTS
jgi:acyl-CoA synthetase (AMP-forming)/AMP-acid ligase II